MKSILYIMAAMLCLAACSDSNSGPTVSEGTLTIDGAADTWTYVSLETGRTIGTCELGDTVGERAWAERTDWDIAVCNGMIRTNSGTSGQGQGGIVGVKAGFTSADIAPEDDYKADLDTVEVW